MRARRSCNQPRLSRTKSLEREIDLKGQRALVYGINRQHWQQGGQAQTRSI
jgi:hypothetical protein